MQIGKQNLQFGMRTYIMGILNVTPDSFSNGGKFNTIDAALKQAFEMQADGADIVDIGGESTRPGHTPVDAKEETDRVLPVIEALVANGLQIPISIDTSKAVVARRAVKAGAALINDVWGFKKDAQMATTAAQLGVPCCLMHNRNNRDYTDLIGDMITDLEESIQIAISAGVKEQNIIIDPGIGFAKGPPENFVILQNLDRFKILNKPILLGTSRKSFIGLELDLPTDQRLEGTIASNVIGIGQGADIIRVHDVREHKRAAVIADRVYRN